MVGCDFFFLQIAGPISGRLIGGGQNLGSDVILFSQVNLLVAGGLISGGGDLKSEGNFKSDSILFYRQICL